VENILENNVVGFIWIQKGGGDIEKQLCFPVGAFHTTIQEEYYQANSDPSLLHSLSGLAPFVIFSYCH